MREDLESVYRHLLGFFGPQGWWPTSTYGGSPKYWVGRRKPLSSQERLEICLGAILTQNTSWKNVERALINLLGALSDGLSVHSFLRIPPRRLVRLIRSSGYFRQKAKKLRAFCIYLRDHCRGQIGNLFKGSIGEQRERVLSQYGIGPETADSILLYAGQQPVFVVDAYTRRILNRTGLCVETTYDQIQRFFHQRLAPSVQIFQEFHALFVALGKDYCLKRRPLCAKCPLQKSCMTAGQEVK